MRGCETRTQHSADVSRVWHVSDTDTRKSVSDTPNEMSNILIFFRTRGHGKDMRRTRQGTRVLFKKKIEKVENKLFSYSLSHCLSECIPFPSHYSRCSLQIHFPLKFQFSFLLSSHSSNPKNLRLLLHHATATDSCSSITYNTRRLL